MTPYRERLHNGDFEPDTTPAQPKDVSWKDKNFLKKTGQPNLATTKTTTTSTTTTKAKP